MKCAHRSSSSKTPQCFAVVDLSKSFKGLPKAGTMRNGVCTPRPVLGPPTSENASWSLPTPNGAPRQVGLLPTPCASEYSIPKTDQNLFVTSSGSVRARRADGRTSQVNLAVTVMNLVLPLVPSMLLQIEVLRKEGFGPTLPPRFVEWMMGFPQDWTDVV